MRGEGGWKVVFTSPVLSARESIQKKKRKRNSNMAANTLIVRTLKYVYVTRYAVFVPAIKAEY